jgi:ABC-2 type transport system permease protein
VLTIPIFFARSAIYPIDIMPSWLKVVSLSNPLIYDVDALRALMLDGHTSKYGIEPNCAVLLPISVLLVAIATRICSRMTD